MFEFSLKKSISGSSGRVREHTYRTRVPFLASRQSRIHSFVHDHTHFHIPLRYHPIHENKETKDTDPSSYDKNEVHPRDESKLGRRYTFRTPPYKQILLYLPVQWYTQNLFQYAHNCDSADSTSRIRILSRL